MLGDLLQTKMYVPKERPSLVSRPRLIEKLNGGLNGKLTLISASAGFGKTTLVSEWVQQCCQPLAWLSLDESDNDLTRFLTYIIAALQSIDSNVGQGLLAALQSPEEVNVEVFLTTLLNEISESPKTLFSSSTITTSSNLRLLTRPSPFSWNIFLHKCNWSLPVGLIHPYPLSRLRAQGQKTEIRAHDLRFTREETAVTLNLTESNADVDPTFHTDVRGEAYWTRPYYGHYRLQVFC